MTVPGNVQRGLMPACLVSTEKGHLPQLASWRRWPLSQISGRFPMALSLPTVMSLLFPRRAASVLQGTACEWEQKVSEALLQPAPQHPRLAVLDDPGQPASSHFCKFLVSSSNTCLCFRRVTPHMVGACPRTRHCTPGADRRHCIYPSSSYKAGPQG